jgi:Family of unknown function (DUF5941)
VLDTVDTSRHRDDGPLVRAVLGRARVRAPLVFALVAALAALVLVIFPGRLLLIFVALLALAAGLPAARRHRAPLDWLVPAALRATEYLLVAAVARIGDVPPPVVFALLFALALHHYDLVARMEKGAPTGSGAGALLGWDGRIVLLTVAALAGVATAGEAVLAVLVAGGFLITAVADRRRAGRVR